VDGSRCLLVEVRADEVDLVSGLLWQGGVTGIHELALGHGRVRLIAGLPAAAEAALVADLVDRWTVDAFDADHDGWLDAWRPFARPVRAGRVVIHPPWEPPPWPDLPTGPDDLVLAIDPGRAFGQGNHATTRLVVEALTGAVTPGAAVLDVGCGSGVLSVVAAALGAAHVDAVDIEDEAVRATVENAVRNDVADLIDASTAAVDALDGPYDVVAANILAPVLVDLAADLARCLGERGVLVLSGLLVEQRGLVLDAFAEGAGLGLVAERELDGWLALELRRG
jgi:ribosomal protein L11 methyltransferase